MTDIRTIFIDMEHGADWLLSGGLLDEDDGLVTAVMLSLFSDARASDDEPLPPGQTERRGWWADALAEVDGDSFGSLLWLMQVRKQLPSALVEAKLVLEASLDWMVADGLAASVEVETFIPRDEVLGALVRIYKPDGSVLPIRFETLWSAL